MKNIKFIKDIKCGICSRYFSSLTIAQHAKRTHNIEPEKYYLQFVGTAGKCRSCGSKTRFITINKGYVKYCSEKCANSNSDKKKLVEKTCIERYGVKNVFQNEDIKEKISNSSMEKYGVAHPSQSKLISDKIRNSLVAHFGEDYGKELSRRAQESIMKKYGVRNYNQTFDGAYKSKLSSYKKKPYILPSGKTIYKQGYEPKLLDHIFKNNLLKEDDIVYYTNGVKYMACDNKERYYFPDFYIPKINLFIECKSEWTLGLDKNIKNKEMAVVKNGAGYLCVVDNNFSEIDLILRSV